MLRFFVLFLALLVPAALADAAPDKRPPVVILIALDGFRPDYLERGVTPHLSALAARGVSAAMRPAFPSKTFPNHWTLVTGQVPDHHGIVANRFEDPARPGEVFTMASDDPFWWNAAEPIWVTAERAGVRTATMFWPGSNVGWGGTKPRGFGPVEGGIRPQDWQHYNQAVSNRQRVNAVIDLLRRPAATRPRLITLYFDSVDTAGHEFGPDDPRTTATVAAADQSLGELLAGLKGLKQAANLVIVADHGMAAVSSERVIPLDQLADPALYRVIESGPYASLVPAPGEEDRLLALLGPGRPMQCWKKAQIPARLRYGSNARVPPLLCLAEIGWTIAPTRPAQPFAGGAHGYDPAAPEMAALFIAAGPQLARGVRLEPFDNVAVAPLLRHLLSLPPAPKGDGSIAPFTGVLRP